jgi:hypothetical protein
MLDTQIATIADWGPVYARLEVAMHKVGTEKLKPIYEEVGELYDYNLIRLARLVYSLV